MSKCFSVVRRCHQLGSVVESNRRLHVRQLLSCAIYRLCVSKCVCKTCLIELIRLCRSREPVRLQPLSKLIPNQTCTSTMRSMLEVYTTISVALMLL